MRTPWYSLYVVTSGSTGTAGASAVGTIVQRAGDKRAAPSTASLRKRAWPTCRTGARPAAPLRAKICSWIAVSFCGAGAASGGTTGGVPSRVIGMCWYRAARELPAPGRTRLRPRRTRTRPPSIRTTAPRAFRHRSSRRTAPARTPPCGLFAAARRVPSLAVTANRRAPATGAPPKSSISRAVLSGTTSWLTRSLPSGSSTIAAPAAAGRLRNATPWLCVALRSVVQLDGDTSACVSCASTLTAGGSGGRSPSPASCRSAR